MKCTKCNVNNLLGDGLDALSQNPKYDEICKDCEAVEVAEQIEAYYN